MAHAFRKYLSNRGSALFMVLSTMTALLITCMAMYFSVVSSRTTHYAVFYQQQAYQSATSINEALLAGILDGELDDIGLKMVSLGVGESITTDSNGFKAFGELTNPKEESADFDSQVGAYTVTITRLEDEVRPDGKKAFVFDIATTTSVNGVKEVQHSIIYVEGSTAEEAMPAPAQIFAATGYVPNDVFLDGGRYITDLFFDNELTMIGAYNKQQLALYGNLATGGSLTINGYISDCSPDSAQTFAIRNTLTVNGNGSVPFASPSHTGGKRSLVMIGGDCIFNNNNGFANADVYINGDLYLRGNADLSTSNYFVNGNIYVEGGIWVNLSKVRCNGIVNTDKNSGGGINGAVGGTWSDSVAPTFYTKAEMLTMLDEKTATNIFYKWTINSTDSSKDDYIAELDESSSSANKKTLHFSMDYTNPIPTQVLKYGDDGKGCIIEDVTLDIGNNAFNCITVLIDTGEDEDNVYTIRVKANRDFTGPDGVPDGINETFSWYPLLSNNPSVVLSILVKGKGSVVIDIPEGVTYQDMSFAKTMHYGWFVLGGGTENHTYGTSDEKTIFDARPVDHGNADLDFASFIHSDCHSGDGCGYSEGNSSNKCTLHEDTKMTTVTCTVHGDLNEFCKECNPEKVGDHYGECKNHVGRKEIDTYLNSHSALATRMGYDSNGKRIYPTTNIFLVSCDESANIRLSVMSNNEGIIQNGFFGYIYAPYMTFKAAYANQGGTMVRLMGGLTVSDYILQDAMSMLACWPEKMPTDLMGESSKNKQLQGVTSKSWKISLRSH